MIHVPRLVCLSIALLLSACGGGGSSSTEPQSTIPPIRPPTLAEAVDGYAQATMKSYSASAMTISVLKNGAPLYERGYGFRDAAKTVPLPADALMRTASAAKPITAAAIMQFAAQGKLALGDYVFCTGANAPCHLPATLLPAGYDKRLGDITISHMINHRSGWDRGVSGDPGSMEPAIRDSLGLQRPPTRAEVIRFILARPLDFAPNARSAYSNVGYLMLGEIVEQKAQRDFTPHVHATILAPLGVSAADFKVAQTLLKDRDPREPVYLSSDVSPSVYNKGTSALAMNEGLVLENWVGAGGVISTARALAVFASAYRLPDGTPITGSSLNGVKDGNLPGVTTVVRQLGTGVTYAVMINAEVPSAQQASLYQQMDAAIAAAGQ